MAIDILQRYYSVELIWMKYIGTSPILAGVNHSTANIIVRSFDAAPVYAGLAIYLTWEDHGCPDLWHHKELLKCTTSHVCGFLASMLIPILHSSLEVSSPSLVTSIAFHGSPCQDKSRSQGTKTMCLSLPGQLPRESTHDQGDPFHEVCLLILLDASYHVDAFVPACKPTPSLEISILPFPYTNIIVPHYSCIP
jgi:hypothetical protein